MPASFPGAVKTFASRSAGQTIDASHVNDLQDEVNAIADGIINGSAPLNSSRITAPALSVSAGSTLTTLSVTGASTFAGTVTMAGELLVATSPPSARVFNSALIQVPADAATGLNFDSQRYLSTSSMHSTSANSSRLTAGHSTGIYDIVALIELSTAGSPNTRQVRLVLNDATVIAYSNIVSSGAALVPVHAHWRMTSTADYVTVQVYFGGSTGRVLQGSAYTPEFMMAKFR